MVRLIEKGLIVELPDSVDGFVPMSQLAKDNLSKPADAYQIDDALTLAVIEFNKENKKIVLSEKNAGKMENREAKAAAAAEKAAAEAEPVPPAEEQSTAAEEDEQPAEKSAAAEPEAETGAEEPAADESAAESGAEESAEEKPKRARKKKSEE